LRYSGRTCSVEIAADTVRPYQQPRPPIVLGGNAGPRAARLAARYADEYNKSLVEPAAIVEAHDRIRRACEAIGRDPASMVYSSALTLCCGTTEADIARRAETIGRTAEQARALGAAGTPSEVLDRLGALADAGVDRFYLQVLDMDDLDQLHLVAEEILPHAPGR
jgi:alkanesulfonate monooxygenase SsuD/methylene tetrahydromethanopterin reductase-like flavin-dependent oxidoreductase (luciferase family)